MKNLEEQRKMMAKLKCIKRPIEITDDILWDLLSKMLEFDPNKRITAAEALKHPYFTSPEAIADISKEQNDLAQLATAEQERDSTITEFDKDPTFIVSESVVQQFLIRDLQNNKQYQQNQEVNIKEHENEKGLQEEIQQTVFEEQQIGINNANEESHPTLKKKNANEMNIQQLIPKEFQQSPYDDNHSLPYQSFNNSQSQKYFIQQQIQSTHHSQTLKLEQEIEDNNSKSKDQIVQTQMNQSHKEQLDEKQLIHLKQQIIQPQFSSLPLISSQIDKQSQLIESSQQHSLPLLQSNNFCLQSSSSSFIYFKQKFSSSFAQYSDQQLSGTNFSFYHQHSYTNNQQQTMPQISLAYAITEQQLQIERNLIEMNISLEKINELMDQFENLSLLERDIICTNLHKRLINNEQNCKQALQIGIINKLIDKLNIIPIENIYLLHCDALVIVQQQCTCEQKIKLKEKGIINWVGRTLITTNEDVLKSATYNLHKLISVFLDNQEIKEQNELRDEMEKDGTLKKLLEIFFNNQYEFQQINCNEAVSIASLYKGAPLPKEFRTEIIKNLKVQVQCIIHCLQLYSLNALSYIAECQDNHLEILSENFVYELLQNLEQDWKESYYKSTLHLLKKLFANTTNENMKGIIKQINRNRIVLLSQYKDYQIAFEASEFLKIVDDQFLKLQDSQYKINNMNEQEDKIDVNQIIDDNAKEKTKLELNKENDKEITKNLKNQNNDDNKMINNDQQNDNNDQNIKNSNENITEINKQQNEKVENDGNE